MASHHNTSCHHCGQPVPSTQTSSFCCSGCAAAYQIIKDLELDSYYRKRDIDPAVKPLIPEMQTFPLMEHFETTEEDGLTHLYLMVDGLHCAACVWLIEHVLQKEEGLKTARLNMTTHRLHLAWNAEKNTAQSLITAINNLGYTVAPYNPNLLKSDHKAYEKKLLLCLGVAGFSAANVMLLSVALWAGAAEESPTLALFLQWLSALIVLPTTVYAGQPFFTSALTAIRAKRFNMDVPISLALCLTLLLSFIEMTRPLGEAVGHTWFESSAMLLFFLLIGRYLDHRTKGKTQNAADRFSALTAHSATRLTPKGGKEVVPIQSLKKGDIILIHAGETCPADGVITLGESSFDKSLLTGESLPVSSVLGDNVSAGTINLTNPLHVRITAVGGATQLNHIARLVEEASISKNAYTRVADKISRLYAPVVHILSGITFLGWFFFSQNTYEALTVATSVLIVTCPCALALAVPTVQVAAVSRLLKQGILVTSASGLERLANIKSAVFDKTGTLTTGAFTLIDGHQHQLLPLAASLARYSSHPLAFALSKNADTTVTFTDIQEVKGAGISAHYEGQRILLGRAAFVGVPDDLLAKHPTLSSHLWCSFDNNFEVFTFKDQLKPEAITAISLFKSAHIPLYLCSGDTQQAVTDVQTQLDFSSENTKYAATPEEKFTFIEHLSQTGLAPLMCGDGINDAPSLAAAHASIAMGSGADISQLTADIILQKNNLLDAFTAFEIAKKAKHLMQVNFGLSFGYNAVAIPLAMLGYITPLWAAIFMSTSSVTVVLNALRLHKMPVKR